jgi:drug/metabolite transporter (DMT)-like permease
LPASFVSITLLGEPIGSTILAFLVLREIPSAFELTGGALILLGIVLSSRQQR